MFQSMKPKFNGQPTVSKAPKTKIIHQYRLPYEIRGCLALSSELCVVLGCAVGETGRFLLLSSGEIDVLDYQIPTLKWGHFNYRAALYRTESGFGCVLDHKLVEYNCRKNRFKVSDIKGKPILDEQQRETGPLGTAFKISKNEILVTMEDHFYKHKGRYFTKLEVGLLGIQRSKFLFSMTSKKSQSVMDCCASFVNDNIVFFRCEYMRMLQDFRGDTSELCVLQNGEVKVIAELSKGFGKFSSDNQHLLVKTYSKPYVLEFYSLRGEKLFTIPLTPKKVIGDIDKRYLTHFDKYDNKLWMGRNDVVTETEFQIN